MATDPASATVLVTAATGTVGRHVVEALADTDATVRAASRDPSRAGERFEPGTAVEFDFARPETWGRALEGVDAVFLVRPPGVAVEELTAFVDAAARVGVDRLAYLSTLGADRNPLIPHYRIERHIESADIDYCFLRASFFCQNLEEVHGEAIREADEIFLPAGSGATSFVDARDVGAVGARVLTESGHRNRAYDVTGPEALTYEEVAELFTEVLDRPVRYADPSIPAFVARELSRGRAPGFVALMIGIYTTARLGLAGRVTDDVEELLGRPPRTVREYLEDYADEFAPVGPREPADSSVTPAGTPPEALVRVLNPVLERLLRSPLHPLVSDDLLVLTVTGRRSGREYTFPVGYERRDDTVYVTSYGTTWWKNLRDGGGRVRLVLQGTERSGHAEVIEDDGAVADYLQEYLRRNGTGAARRVGLRIEGETVPEQTAIREAAGGIVVVRIDLEG